MKYTKKKKRKEWQKKMLSWSSSAFHEGDSKQFSKSFVLECLDCLLRVGKHDRNYNGLVVCTRSQT